jgi:hypothetical protein
VSCWVWPSWWPTPATTACRCPRFSLALRRRSALLGP